ncbi:hypothetical protein HNR15_003272 [Allobranchiibius huperziae]|uniref:DUF998 domain-containing protein n=1 Tax=Allobranchiibius huperziae TaxID=1874116 RepID=A0A853DK43_9MICO|nr:hypothetical protein [Allobranchiibius huperziae]
MPTAPLDQGPTADLTTPAPRLSPRLVVSAGAGLVLGAVASAVVEAVVANGWHRPPYSYVDDKVAYLGSPYCGNYEGHAVCSPDWKAMLVTWLANGLLVLGAGLVLGRLVGGRTGVVVRVLALLEAVGFALFSLFHDSPAARADGTITWYFLGAGLVIVVANALPVVVGVAARRFGLPRPVAVVCVALGVFGLVAALATAGWPPGGSPAGPAAIPSSSPGSSPRMPPTPTRVSERSPTVARASPPGRPTPTSSSPT